MKQSTKEKFDEATSTLDHLTDYQARLALFFLLGRMEGRLSNRAKRTLAADVVKSSQFAIKQPQFPPVEQ